MLAFCQACSFCGYCVLAPISTLSVLPAPLLLPLFPPLLPQAASATARTVVPSSATAERPVLKPIAVLPWLACRHGVIRVMAGRVGRRFPRRPAYATSCHRLPVD